VPVINGVIVHLVNDLPVVVDLDEMPGAADQIIRCTNVRTIDGKRPSFVHDRHSTFLFPLVLVRLIEVPQMSGTNAVATQDNDEFVESAAPEPIDTVNEEADEDLLARIRQI